MADAAKPVVLVVEDDEQMVDLMRHELEKDGWAVASAATGKEAKRMIAAMPAPSLVTLDIALPDISGVELILQIKDTAGWEGVPIVMVTATPKGKDVNWAIKSGAQDYLVKPFKPEALRACVRRLAARKPAA